jgi:capsular polysaccharide transport system ATP-binding protein
MPPDWTGTPDFDPVAQLAIDPLRCVEARNITKTYQGSHGSHQALAGISFRVGAGERLGILGANGSGKSTLIKILSGVLSPTSGEVRRGLRLSWPLALGGGFEGQLTGYDNVRFLSGLYGLPFRDMYDYVADFSELGKHMHTPVRFYSDGMRMRLAFALSLAMDFECYLIDEVLVVGDRRFQLKCQDELFGRRQHCGMIMAVHDAGVIKEYCQKVLILKEGRGRLLDDVALAGRIYNTL